MQIPEDELGFDDEEEEEEEDVGHGYCTIEGKVIQV